MWQKVRGIGVGGFSIGRPGFVAASGSGSMSAVPPQPGLPGAGAPALSGRSARRAFTSETEIGKAIALQSYAVTHSIGRKRHVDEDE